MRVLLCTPPQVTCTRYIRRCCGAEEAEPPKFSNVFFWNGELSEENLRDLSQPLNSGHLIFCFTDIERCIAASSTLMAKRDVQLLFSCDCFQVPPPRPHPRVGIDSTDDGLYKVPPTRYTQYQSQASTQGIRGANANSVASVAEDWYQVPPPAKNAPMRQSHDMFYDVPPSRPAEHAHTHAQQRHSNSSNESKGSQRGGGGAGSDSAYGSEDLYDQPPAHRAPDPPGMGLSGQVPPSVGQITRHMRTTTVATSVISQAGDVYDVPPTRRFHPEDNGMLDRVPPPPKPPRNSPPMSPPEEQGPYLNIPPNSKSFQANQRPSVQGIAPPIPSAKRTTVTIDDMYDFPASLGSKDKAMLSLSPPPPPHSCHTGTQHGYVNAPPGFVPTSGNGGSHSYHVDSVYMPMDLGSGAHLNIAGSGLGSDSSPHMTSQRDDLYLPMSSQQQQQRESTRSSGGSAIYTDMAAAQTTTAHPMAPPPPGAQPLPPRLQRLTPQNSQGKNSQVLTDAFCSDNTPEVSRDDVMVIT